MFEIYKTSTATRVWERVRAVFMGLLLFFPAFLLSLPITMMRAKHLWAGEAQAPLGGIGISFWFGIFVAVLSCAYLVHRVNRNVRGTER